MPIDAIVSVRRPQRGDDKRADFVSLAPAGQGDVVLVLRTPVEVHGVLGIRRTITLVGIGVDDREGFLAAIGYSLPRGR